jgi:glycine/D-amino acid oxidase-like deaminating enzyme
VTAGVADVVVIGAGIVGAACAYYASRAGLAVTVLDAGPVVGGTTGAGEGNILVSDKQPGPELALTLESRKLWLELAAELDDFELEHKGGLVVAATPTGLDELHTLADRQEAEGVVAERVDTGRLAEHEPMLAPGLAGGVRYPQDLQVQPMLAAARLLAAARAGGATVRPYSRVVAVDRARDGRVEGVRTQDGTVAAGAVVNAAGTWAGDVARLAGVDLPVRPRRGFVLVTEPLPPLVRHKVYAAEYVGDVASGDAALQSSPVVEGTRAGTVLIGASRELVGFDGSFALPVLRRLAAQAVALFPFLAAVRVLRAYRGFRPFCPDHLPVIGEDPRAPGLFHACGHEGAGIGLAPATGAVVAALLRGEAPALTVAPFRPERFA